MGKDQGPAEVPSSVYHYVISLMLSAHTTYLRILRVRCDSCILRFNYSKNQVKAKPYTLIMNTKIITLAALTAAALALPRVTYSATFFDDFETDTSADYVFTSTFSAGNVTATFDVSGGTLNLPTT